MTTFLATQLTKTEGEQLISNTLDQTVADYNTAVNQHMQGIQAAYNQLKETTGKDTATLEELVAAGYLFKDEQEAEKQAISKIITYLGEKATKDHGTWDCQQKQDSVCGYYFLEITLQGPKEDFQAIVSYNSPENPSTTTPTTVIVTMEKTMAEKHLCDLLNSLDDSVINTYKELVESNEEKRKAARSKIFLGGRDPDEADITDYKNQGYDLTAALSAERTQCEQIVAAIKTKVFNVDGWRWETDIKNTEVSKYPETHMCVELSLVPSLGTSGKTYKAYVSPDTVSTTGNQRWLINVGNPGDSTANNPSGTGAKDTTVALGQLPKGLDSAKNAEMAKKYPERVVEGVYYADDEALAAAKAAYEAKVKADMASGKAAGTTAAMKLAQAMQTVNTNLYGENSSETVAVMSGTVGNVELGGVLGNAISVRERQKLLNWNKFKTDFKAPNSGKPPNNKDPFPVDQKIMELEVHQPTVKIDEILTHVNGVAAAAACLRISNFTEQRLVRLENNIATILRYLYRIGSRMFINCIYYGQNI